MTTARSSLRKRMSELHDDYRSLTTTATGATTAAVITSAALRDYAEDTDSFPYFHALFSVATASTPNEGVSRPVLRTGGNTAATILTVTRAYPSPIGNGDTFELYRYAPDLYHNALNRAAEHLFHKGLYLPVRDESLVVDNVLSNSDFEETVVAGAHPSWTNFGASVTVSGEATIVRHGAQSFKVVADAGAAGGAFQNITSNVERITNKTLRFKKWAYATAASTARLRVSFDGGSTFTNSDYHSGADQWELLVVEVAVPSTATGLQARVEAAAGGTAYFDAGWCIIRPVYRYTIPSTFVYGRVDQVLQQEYESHPDGIYYPVNDDNPPIPGRRLRLIGKNYLSRPTTETGTMEVTGDQLDLVCYQALAFLYESLAAPVGAADRDGFLQNASLWQSKADAMIATKGVLPPRKNAIIPDGWAVERSGTTYNLKLTDDRG